MLFLGAFTKPIITLNSTALKSGEPLQINCSAVKLDKTASFSYEIRVNGTTVAKENNSFAQTTESVKSTEAGTYTCQVSSVAMPTDIVEVLNKEILSGKSNFSIVHFSFMSNMEFFFVFRVVKFPHDGNLDLERANPFQSLLYFI